MEESKRRRPNNDMNIGKILPQNVEIEEAIIGTMINNPNCIHIVKKVLQTDMFYKESSVLIASAIYYLFDNNIPIDQLTVTEELRKRVQLEMAGGPYFISVLCNANILPSKIEHHCRVVAEKSMLRKIISIAEQAHSNAFNSQDVFEVLIKLKTDVMEIENFIVSQRELKDLKKLAYTEIDNSETQRRSNKRSGLMTGFQQIDFRMGGLQKGDLITIGGRPGMGKTALIVSLLVNIALYRQNPCAFFSLEMTTIKILKRIFAYSRNINLNKITSDGLDDAEFEEYHDFLSKIPSDKLFIEDDSIDISELETKATYLVVEKGVKLIVIDYLQLIKNKHVNKNFSKTDIVGDVTTRLKALAKKLDVPIIELSQLSRLSKKQNNRMKPKLVDFRPQLEDLRDSGSIEQDSDIVILLYRPEYYKSEVEEKEWNENGVIRENILEIDCKKFRDGSPFRIDLDWRKECAGVFDKDIPQRVIDFNNAFEQDIPEATF